MRDPITPLLEDQPGILADLPRRKQLDSFSDGEAPAQMRTMNFKFSRLRALNSFYKWVDLVIRFFISGLWDKLLRKYSEERQAVLLRRLFERRGGSFVKIGTQLSMRVDLIPWAISLELVKMKDYLPPFPVTEAIKIVERALKAPLQSIFSQFDPETIGSTIVACIYQAILKDGTRVAVKIRRPGIGEQFMADLQGMDWLLMFAEFLTIFRPGLTKGMRREFRGHLIKELDFVQEARGQDAFRRMAEDSRKKFFSAPKVFLEYATEEVIVEEFAQGMWLWELLAAIENNHEEVLDQARQMNIDPKKVAKRLLWVNYWCWTESLFVIANPHPASIIVGHDSRLYFINFAATGTLNRSKRHALQQIMQYTDQRDPQNMSRAMLALMEPLPPIDLVVLTQELESYNWQLLYNLEADPVSLTWQERTSGVQWQGFVHLAHKYSVVIDTQVLRMVRSSLYFESSAVRLDHRIDFIKQYKKVENHRAEAARRRVTDAIVDTLEGKENKRLIIQLDRVAHTLEGLFFRTRHMLSLPSVNFTALMSKWAFFTFILVRFFVQAIVVTGAGFLVAVGGMFLAGSSTLDPLILLRAVLQQPVYLALIYGLIFINGRTILFRMDDKEVNEN